MSGYDLPIQDNNEREWYANVGRIQEQERIIKLLEDRVNDCTQPILCTNCIGINWAIKIIKGENNE